MPLVEYAKAQALDLLKFIEEKEPTKQLSDLIFWDTVWWMAHNHRFYGEPYKIAELSKIESMGF